MIATDMNLSEKTIEKHRSKMMKRLNVRSVAELVKIAVAASDLNPIDVQQQEATSA